MIEDMQSSPEISTYHLEEYKQLRAEILAHQERRAKTQQFSMAGIAAVYAWLATAGIDSRLLPFLWIGWWVPTAIAFHAYVQIVGMSKGIKRAGSYLAALQETYAGPGVVGWERSLQTGQTRSDREPKQSGNPHQVSGDMRRFWLIAGVGTLILAVLATRTICQSAACSPGFLQCIFGAAS